MFGTMGAPATTGVGVPVSDRFALVDAFADGDRKLLGVCSRTTIANDAARGCRARRKGDTTAYIRKVGGSSPSLPTSRFQ